MLDYEFKINKEDWKIIEEDGYPEDMTECIVLFKMDNGDTHFMIGAYSEDMNNFYVDYGWGGLVLDKEEAYAWCEIIPEQLIKVN